MSFIPGVQNYHNPDSEISDSEGEGSPPKNTIPAPGVVSSGLGIPSRQYVKPPSPITFIPPRISSAPSTCTSLVGYVSDDEGMEMENYSDSHDNNANVHLPQSIPESLISLVKVADDHQLSEEDIAISPDIVNGDHLFFCLTDVKLPPEQAEGVCSQALQEKIVNLMETKRQLGFSSYDVIVKGKSFRNPSIYEKLIQMCEIEEFGSNYSKKSFDPKEFQKEEFYEKLAEVQRKAHESKQKSRGNIEFKSGTKILAPTKPVDSGGGLLPLPSTIVPTAQDSQKKRKSKWDNPSSSMNVSSPTSTDPVVGAQALANARLIDKNLIKLFKQ